MPQSKVCQDGGEEEHSCQGAQDYEDLQRGGCGVRLVNLLVLTSEIAEG